VTSSASDVSSTRRLLLTLPLVAGGLILFGRSSKHAEFNVKEVLVEEARLLVAAGALVIDVRERAAYEAKHIAGALLAPVATLSAAIPASLEGARTQPVVVYCGDGAALGPEGTHVLNKAGFLQAVNLKPGIQGWVAAGLPIESGKGKQA
jgi:rhodanese-related sulfurtransferase